MILLLMFIVDSDYVVFVAGLVITRNISSRSGCRIRVSYSFYRPESINY